MSTSCRCDAVSELYGEEAEDYAAAHLHREDLDSERFEERYSCPDTGRTWILEWPEKTERDPGQARLRAA